jgi:hypothetical protein
LIETLAILRTKLPLETWHVSRKQKNHRAPVTIKQSSRLIGQGQQPSATRNKVTVKFQVPIRFYPESKVEEHTRTPPPGRAA